MDLEKAKLLKIKLTALKAFIRNVATIGTELADYETREDYRKIYKNIKETLADSNLETYAPGISSGRSFGGDGLLWAEHQVQIVNSGTRLISYLEAVLASTFPDSHQSPKKITAPANNFTYTLTKYFFITVSYILTYHFDSKMVNCYRSK